MTTFLKDLPRVSMVGGLALALAITAWAPSAHGNVYATNIKINGGTTNIAIPAGTNVSISYILNEPASGGVTIKVLSGATAARTISAAAGTAGALRGLNTVVWNGKDNNGNSIPGGTYAISITAASSGYSAWTVTSDDNNNGNYTWEARGIAVDRNTNSPYYGRVFVGNSYDNSNNGTSPYFGDYVGIQKLNADGSYADEGGFSTGGIAWGGGYLSPWKIRVSDDDKVYVMDEYNYGEVFRFDPLLSTNSMLHVLRADNVGTAELSGMAVVGTGTNTQLWMADNHSFAGLGILKYAVTTNGTCATNNTGMSVVASGAGTSLDIAPVAVSLDRGGNIYSVQKVLDSGDPAVRVLRFPAYDPATNGGAAEVTATWAVGAGNDFYAGLQGVAVDPTGTYVAAAGWGVQGTSGYINGNTSVFYATNGALVTSVDLGVSLPSKRTTNAVPPLDPALHADTDVDWDAVGNLYYLDDVPGVWRAVSPPGTNQATTVALPAVQIIAVQPPVITSINVVAGTVTVHFTGGTNDPAWAFEVLSAPAATGPYTPIAGARITGSGGSYVATFPFNDANRFYRVVRLVPIPLQITSLRVASGTVTINVTGSPSDPASALTLLSSPVVNGTYSPAAGATIIQVSPGVFQATVPTNGPKQFYRIRE